MGLTAGEINILIRARDQASKVLGRVGNAADKMRKVIRRAGMVGAIALAGLAVAAATTFISFDSAMTKSIAIMGDLDDAMRETMEKTARDVAKTTTFSMTQAAESYFFLASAGLSAEQSIGALPLVAAFAQAGMFDMALATDLLTDAQSALGLTVDDTAQNIENMARVSDVLVKANTLANATVEQFSTALTRDAGAALKSFKIDVEEGVAVLAAFADQGVKGELAGTGLARILRIMTSAAVNNADAYERLGVEVFDATGNINNLADIVGDLEGALTSLSDEQRVAALEALGFSARIQGVILPLLGTSQAIRDYEGALREAAGTTAEVAEKQLESLGAQLSLLRSGFEDVLFTIGQEMEPGLRALVKTLREDVIPAIETFLPAALDKMEQLFRDFQPVIEATAGAFRTFFEFIITNKPILIAALLAIGAAMIVAFPHIAVAAAVVAIVASIQLLMAENDKLGESALRVKLKFLELIKAALELRVTIATLGSNQLPFVGKAFQAFGERATSSKQALDKVRKEIDEVRLAIIDLEAGVRDTTAFEVLALQAIHAAGGVEALRGKIRETHQAWAEFARALGAGIEPLTQRQVLGIILEPPTLPPMVPPSEPFAGSEGVGIVTGEAIGEAMGEAITEALQQSILDMPAIAPEALLRLMRELEAADFMTIGDQLAFVQAMADNAARAAEQAARELEEAAREAREMWESLAVGGSVFQEALAILADLAGVSVKVLEKFFGLRDEAADLGNAIRIVAGAMGMTETQVLLLVSELAALEEAQENVATATDEVTRSLRDELSAVQNAIGAVSDLAGVSRDDLLAVLDELGIIQLPTLQDALLALAQELGLSVQEWLAFIGALEDAQQEAQDTADAIDAIADAANRANDALGALRQAAGLGLTPEQLQEIWEAFNRGTILPPGGGGPGLPVPEGGAAAALTAGLPAQGIVQNITIIVEERSPAAIANAVERAGLELGAQLAAEGV